VIDLRNSSFVFDSQIMDDGAVLAVFPAKIDVVGRLLLALGAGTDHPNLVFDVSPLLLSQSGSL